MVGASEILIIAVVGTAVIVGATLVRRVTRKSAAGPSPSMPDKAPAASLPVAAAPAETHAVVDIGSGDVLVRLREHAAEAERRGLRPFVEFGTSWCPPSVIFGRSLSDPRMEASLAGVYLIRVDADRWDYNLAREVGFNIATVPVFYELDAEGRPTGHSINGGAWGADTIENMSRVMTRFFAG